MDGICRAGLENIRSNPRTHSDLLRIVLRLSDIRISSSNNLVRCRTSELDPLQSSPLASFQSSTVETVRSSTEWECGPTCSAQATTALARVLALVQAEAWRKEG